MNADEHVCFLVLPRSFSRFPTHESAALAECAQNLNASVVRCSSMLPSNDAELQAMIPASSILVLCLSSAEALMLGGFADISYATLLESAQRLCPGRVALLFRGPDRDAHSAREFVDSLAARGNRLPPQYAAVFSAKLAFAADSEYAAFVAQLPAIVTAARRNSAGRPRLVVFERRPEEPIASPGVIDCQVPLPPLSVGTFPPWVFWIGAAALCFAFLCWLFPLFGEQRVTASADDVRAAKNSALYF